MTQNENVKRERPRTKIKLKVTNYEKKFETFTDMIKELKTLHPEMNNIFTYDEENVYPKDAADDVLTYFSNNHPDIIERTNLPVAISVSSNKVSLKTNKFFSFKWQFKYDRNGFASDIIANIFVYEKGDKISRETQDMLNHLNAEENGWAIIERER